jgi:ParB family chromosome partitioning protein
MAENKAKKTETFASIFGDDFSLEDNNENDDGVTKLKLETLVPFKNHPFKLYEGDRFNDMVESIKNLGVIVPIVVRKKGLRYEILSGHNRVNSAKVAGLDEIPAVVKEGLTEEEAILIVTETNLMQRSFSDLAHSERATVIATRHNAMKGQGIRNDLLNEIEKLSKAPGLAIDETCGPLDHKLKTRDKVGEEYGLSPRSITRYIRLNYLNSKLKDLVDEGKIAMRAGVDLSYLINDSQEMIEAIISENTFKVDMKKASTLRAFDKSEKLTWDKAVSIISGEVTKKEKKPAAIKIQPQIISKYFRPNENKKDIEKVIEKALEMYFTQIKEAEIIVEDEDEEEIG